MNYKRPLFIWLILIMFSGGLMAQVYTETIVKNYSVSDKSTVEVSNKYGKVHVVTWAKDSVKFVVDLRISSTDAKKMSKLKTNISFDFTNTSYYTIGRTKFAKSGGVFSDMVETIIPSNDVSINYTLYIPDYVNLKIDNKFGDVYIDDFSGKLDLNLSNGGFKANKLEGKISISLNSADGMVNYIKGGTVRLRYSDMEFRELDKINLDTKFSKINIETANLIKIVSRRDSYIIGEVNILSGSGDFTKMSIESLNKEINFSNKYYSVLVENINTSFDLVNLHSELTDIDLRFQAGASYNLDVTHHPEVSIRYPSVSSKLETKELMDEDRLLLTYGTVGEKVNTSTSKVKIVAEKKCRISLIHKQ